MKERPIIFSSPMVRGILAGTKTQTRRVVKPQPTIDEKGHWLWKGGNYGVTSTGQPATHYFAKFQSPYGVPGDRLWVREAWRHITELSPGVHHYHYAATDEIGEKRYFKWRSPIHMPRDASRITLEIVGVRVERVQDITEEDAKAEGMRSPLRECAIHRKLYAELWDSLNAKRGHGWDANPWVWVIEFRKIE